MPAWSLSGRRRGGVGRPGGVLRPGEASLLLPGWLAAAPAAMQPLDPTGLACVLGAALCWALYIVFG
ncbi:MAG TPA: hypothetical protein VGN94_07505, partial [Methylobacterium sp.]|nr:hypothetical protein [Methylobacterium sp.]